MINQELIKKLRKFPLDFDVIISDGYNLNFYSLDNAEFRIFKNQIDIGIGGCEIENDKNYEV